MVWFARAPHFLVLTAFTVLTKIKLLIECDIAIDQQNHLLLAFVVLTAGGTFQVFQPVDLVQKARWVLWCYVIDAISEIHSRHSMPLVVVKINASLSAKG